MPMRSTLSEAATLVGREVAMQIQRRRGPSVVERNGVKVEIDDAWANDFMRDMIYSGWYEAHELGLLRDTLEPGDRYLEVGAGIGVLASAACAIVGARNVVAVEANPRLVAVARHTAGLNGHEPDVREGVVVAEGTTGATVPFYLRRDFWESSMEPSPGAQRVELPAIPLRAALDEVGATYLNMDAEGAETELLREPLPQHVRRLCVELHPEAVGRAALSGMVKRLLDQGFELDVGLSRSEVFYFAR
jgi:FkbM family methyltransferase